MNAESITPLDGTVLFVMLVAIARGGYIGMIRESFSIAAVGASCIALRFGNVGVLPWPPPDGASVAAQLGVELPLIVPLTLRMLGMELSELCLSQFEQRPQRW